MTIVGVVLAAADPGATPPVRPLGYDRRLDVNLDGLLTPLDALLIVNRINTAGITEAILGTAVAAFDVNRDGWVTALDVLWVITYLNGVSAQVAEPEAFPAERPIAVLPDRTSAPTLAASARALDAGLPEVDIDSDAIRGKICADRARELWEHETFLPTDLEDTLADIVAEVAEIWWT